MKNTFLAGYQESFYQMSQLAYFLKKIFPCILKLCNVKYSLNCKVQCITLSKIVLNNFGTLSIYLFYEQDSYD